MMNKIFFLFILFTFCIFYAQSSRKAFTLEIAADETHQYQSEVSASPYFVKDKVLQIFCGETLFIECEVKGDTISMMKVVEENINPDRTIEINFSQNSEDRKNIITSLIVTNPFNKKLNYNAMMYTPKYTTWKETSIIPIGAKLQNFETWPHSIITLVLDKWRFED